MSAFDPKRTSDSCHKGGLYSPIPQTKDRNNAIIGLVKAPPANVLKELPHLPVNWLFLVENALIHQIPDESACGALLFFRDMSDKPGSS